MKDMVKSIISENRYLLFVVFLLSMILSNMFCVYWIIQMENAVNEKFKTTDEKIGQLSNQVDNLSVSLRTLMIDEKEFKKNPETIKISSNAINDYYFDEYTDLKDFPEVSIEDLNYILDRWDEVTGGYSNFTGKGDYFMAASLRSGYNPIYIIAHAAIESGWGTSNLALYYGNLFGIGSYDYGSGYYVADSIEQGIIKGSIWINTYFYLEGYNTLNAMQNGGYAANPNWQYDIVSIVRTSYIFLKEAEI